MEKRKRFRFVRFTAIHRLLPRPKAWRQRPGQRRTANVPPSPCLRTENVVRKKAVTIKDVAKAANVSITTVSRVINNNMDAVNKATGTRIRQVIEELRFVPNAMARGLHSSHTKTIGLVIQDISNPYYPGIVQGVEDTAQKLGYSLFLANAQRSHTRTCQYFDIMREKRVDGMILVGGGIVRDADRENIFAAEDLRTVVIGKPAIDCVSVQIDNVEAGRLAGRHLLERGHRAIAMISGFGGSNSVGDREQGYCQALEEYGLVPERRWAARGNFTYESGAAAVDKLPLTGAEKITAIFAHNDLMAIGAINALSRKGYRVPEDISVVGFDDIQLSSYFSPALTTVSVPFSQMGRQAMECLARLLKGKKVERTTYLPVCIRDRGTVCTLDRAALPRPGDSEEKYTPMPAAETGAI